MPRLLERPAAHLGALAALCLLGYAPALGRYFVSEDFFVLRRLASGGLWETAWGHLTGPLLGITFVQFYRPVSASLIHAEYLMWGTEPAGYLLTHLAVHLANSALLYRLARHWADGDRTLASGVTLIFALYPLHPNAVVFVSAFATLFSTTFLLASLALYERARSAGGGRALAGSVACFVLALGSYEQTVVLPVFLAARELLAARDDRPAIGRRAIRRLAALWVPYLAVLAAYFLARQAVLGQVLAGYSSFRERLLAGEALKLGRGLLDGFVHLVHPDYDRAVGAGSLAVAGLVLLAASAWALRRGGRERRLWLFGLLWVLATQAPFAFEKVVPGNGRYWYLTSIGLALLIAAAAGLLGRTAPVRARLAPRFAVAALTGLAGLGYFLLLVHYTGIYAAAGRTARTIQTRLAERSSAGERVFVAGCPDFLRGRLETPVAQVFHWGLSDALEPPFVAGGPVVYPLTRLADSELLPVTERADLGTAWRWNAESGDFEPLAPPPADMRRIATRVTGGGLEFRPDAGSHRLVILARGSASVYSAPVSGGGGWVSAPVPEPVVRSMRQLYGGAVYAWIEAREGHRLVAVSRLEEIAGG